MADARASTRNTRRLTRRPVDQTRNLMLGAAIELLVESITSPSADALPFAVSNIRVTDVVAAATRIAVAAIGGEVDEFVPISVGALYQIWPTQPEFQADVLRHLASLGAVVFPSAAITNAHLSEGLDGEDLLLLTMREAWTHARSDPLFRLMLAVYPRMANEQIRTMVADGYERFCESVESGWINALKHVDRRMRPPYTVTHLARSVAAVIEGFSLQWIPDPHALADPEGDEHWDLATRAIIAVINAYTEPTEAARG